MEWAAGFIAVDWGTTNRRAYRLDGEGTVVDRFEDDCGALSVGRARFPAAAATVRDRLGDLPMLLGGLAGSTLGWMDAPYVACPAGLGAIVDALVWPEARVAIVPGVRTADGDRPDVMRGEEIQLLGAVRNGMIPPDCLVCHPGTHTKWARMRDGRIAHFRSAMTGELFALLSRDSILAADIVTEAAPGPAFERGVRVAQEDHALAAAIFQLRAALVLGRERSEDSASFLSGVLIGDDVAQGLALAEPDESVVVMGRPSLCRLYAAAIALLGSQSREVDGTSAFLAGATEIVRSIR